MPQAQKLLEKFKAEVDTTSKGRAESGDESGVAFEQAKIWAHSMVCHHCGVNGHRVNECPKLTHAQRKQFWGSTTRIAMKRLTHNRRRVQIIMLLLIFLLPYQQRMMLHV